MQLRSKTKLFLFFVFGSLSFVHAETGGHSGGGFNVIGRPIADPSTGARLDQLTSACLLGRPGDFSGVGAGAIGAGAAVPPPVLAGPVTTPTSVPSSTDAAPTSVAQGGAGFAAFVSVNCNGCHNGTSGTGDSPANFRISKGGKQFSIAEALKALDTVPKMRSDVPASVKSQLASFAAAK